MANSLMNFFSGNNSIMLRAVGAMMRGESPKDFLRTLADTRPELRNVDMDDINGFAERLCRERGVDANKLAEQIRQYVGK